MTFCSDGELAYLASRTSFIEGKGLILDESYRLAHLPLVAPDHPRVIRQIVGKPYLMGRHTAVESLVLPVSGDALQGSSAGQALEAELRAAPFGHKIAWNIAERRRDKLHATICGALASGEEMAELSDRQRAALAQLGSVRVELRGLFSGNVNLGRLYLKAYPEKRNGFNMFHRIQQIMGRRETDLYVVGLYNLVDDLDPTEAAMLAGMISRWWDKPILTFRADTLWLLRAMDDLVLDGTVRETISLR
ncbi:MAG: hypothetical protein JSR91_07185 [Proteobacteria bacterium]|nr:hypothetical protein [Pseudomonadota bacterium]